MKRLISLASIMVLIFALCVSVNATDARATTPNVTLTFSGNTAYCKARITSAGASIDAKMTLKQGSTVIASWSGSDTSALYLEGEQTVTKGSTYTLEVSGTANGKSFSATTSGKC